MDRMFSLHRYHRRLKVIVIDGRLKSWLKFTITAFDMKHFIFNYILYKIEYSALDEPIKQVICP